MDGEERAPSMEGRYPRGIIFCITCCTDHLKEEDFNYWYNHVHIPDVIGPRVFERGMRFANTDPTAGELKCISTYETEWEDLDKAWQLALDADLKLQEDGRCSSELKIVMGGAFKRVGGEFRAADRPVRGILAALANCKDPAGEMEFNRWHSDVHIPDILGTGLFHAAYRYESIDPEATWGKYLALYETDSPDPGQAAARLREFRAKWERAGRWCENAERVLLISARRIWPAY